MVGGTDQVSAELRRRQTEQHFLNELLGNCRVCYWGILKVFHDQIHFGNVGLNKAEISLGPIIR